MLDRTEWGRSFSYVLLEYSCKFIRNLYELWDDYYSSLFPPLLNWLCGLLCGVFTLHWHWNITVFNFPLNELHCTFWALSAGLTCCFLMQRLTDNGAAQKLPPSGLNAETAQGDALPTVMLSLSCCTLYALSELHSKIFPCLSLSFCLVFIIMCCSLLPVVQ